MLQVERLYLFNRCEQISKQNTLLGLETGFPGWANNAQTCIVFMDAGGANSEIETRKGNQLQSTSPLQKNLR
jgi:hypothetical protein